MSKAVMISIRPKWCEKIASGKKAIEVRKTRPKLQTPFKCYIYCTRDKHLAFMQNQTGTNLIACMNAETAIPVGGFLGNGKVIGEFTCSKIELVVRGTSGKYAGRLFVKVPDPDGGIRFSGYKEIKAYEKQMCLSESEIVGYLSHSEPRGRGGYLWHISALKIYDTPKELSEFQRATDPCDSCRAEYTWECTGCKKLSGDIKRPFQSWGYVEELR